MGDDASIRISLAHASEHGVAQIRVLVDAVPAHEGFARGGRSFHDRAIPRIEAGVLVVPRGCARETWSALFHSNDPRALAVAYRLFAEIQHRGWVDGLWRSEWDDTAERAVPCSRPRGRGGACRRVKGRAPEHGNPPPMSVA